MIFGKQTDKLSHTMIFPERDSNLGMCIRSLGHHGTGIYLRVLFGINMKRGTQVFVDRWSLYRGYHYSWLHYTERVKMYEDQ